MLLFLSLFQNWISTLFQRRDGKEQTQVQCSGPSRKERKEREVSATIRGCTEPNSTSDRQRLRFQLTKHRRDRKVSFSAPTQPTISLSPSAPAWPALFPSNSKPSPLAGRSIPGHLPVGEYGRIHPPLPTGERHDPDAPATLPILPPISPLWFDSLDPRPSVPASFMRQCQLAIDLPQKVIDALDSFIVDNHHWKNRCMATAQQMQVRPPSWPNPNSGFRGAWLCGM
jgi:hypothetical protein